jgi:hypothetical protein
MAERNRRERVMHLKRRLLVTLGSLAGLAVALALALTSHAAGSARLAGTAASCGSSAGSRAFASYTPALRTYDDDIEDSGNAPDFCATEFVTNDNSTITMGIHAHNRPGFESGDSYGVYLDTDRNPATGGGGVGAEYEIVFDAPRTAKLEQWNGTEFDAASARALPLAWAPDYGPVFVFLRTAIGDPAAFNFVLTSTNGTDSDRAPDAGSWSYTRRAFALKMRPLSVGPARAGSRLTVRAFVLRSDYDEPLVEGKIGCAARFSGHRLTGKGRFAAARATCAWRLPKSARGKRLSGTVSVVYQGVQVKRAFTVRVR